MFTKLFSDYKSPEEVDFIFAMKKLKNHYTLYFSLISSWEELIMSNTKYLFADWGEEELATLKEYNRVENFGQKEIEQIIREGSREGPAVVIEKLVEKYCQVEMMLGHTLIKKNVASREIDLSDYVHGRVSCAEALVEKQKQRLRSYPKKIGELTLKVGKGLVKKNRIVKTLEILDVIKHARLLGASNKREMMRLLKEQNWTSLDIFKCNEVATIQRAALSLKNKLIHFEKELKDELGLQLQKPSFDGFVHLLEFLTAVKQRAPEWEDNSFKFTSLFKTEMDKLLNLIIDPRQLLEATLKRLIDLWFSPLRVALEPEAVESIIGDGSPTKKKVAFEMFVAMEPSALITCVITIVENLCSTIGHWDRLAKFTYVYEKILTDKITFEDAALGYLAEFRNAMFLSKNTLCSMAMQNIEKYLSMATRAQLGRVSPKSLIKLRSCLSTLSMKAELFSYSPQKTSIESVFENLLDTYLDQSLSASVEMLIAILRTTDAELSSLDLEVYKTQLQEISSLSKEVTNEKWFYFGNGTSYISSSMEKARQTLSSPVNKESIKEITNNFTAALKKIVPVDVNILCAEPLQRINKILGMDSKQMSHLRVDNAGSVVLTLIVTYSRLWLFFPEFKAKVQARANFIFQLYYFISVARSLPPLSLQFLLAQTSNLNNIENEEGFAQLENFSDIVLFQGRFNSLRRLLKKLNDSVSEGLVPGMKDKLISTLTELLVQTALRSDSKDKTGMQLQRIMKTIYSLSSVNEVTIFDDMNQEISEMTDFLFYNLLLTHTRDQQVLAKATRVKWEELKDPEGTSEYVSDVIMSIKNLVSLIQKLGKLNLFSCNHRIQ
jgi:hypothetical protein